jgi:DNA-binding NarL/FixJ family response regulator
VRSASRLAARAVRTVAAEETLLVPAVTRRLVERFVRRADGSGIDILTTRERDVLREIARGLSNQEIAERLVVSHATVKSHVASILRKYNLRDRAQAVFLAYESDS